MKKMTKASLLLSSLTLACSLAPLPAIAQSTDKAVTSAPATQNWRPSTEAMVVFHYYKDLAAATAFYEDKIGLEKVSDFGWASVFKVTPTSYLGLTMAKEDSPKSKKSSAVSISTNDLGAWHARLAKHSDIKFLNHIKSTAGGLVEEFKIEDPEGYSLEFFRWSSKPDAEYPLALNPFEK
jgi:predicted enzyme related to lactoylglutathione lyase